MADTLPQFYPNHLKPISFDVADLRDTLRNLKRAIRKGIQIVLSLERPGLIQPLGLTYGTIFTGDLGMFIKQATTPAIQNIALFLTAQGLRSLSCDWIIRNFIWRIMMKAMLLSLT
jgi:hypothetical protein